ncbi:aminoacyl-tRNA deacylase [Roseovarius nitratireducens]|uniref:aminoacyl-tRNA deacylase n=1 Tax=Roseovarius nitratireducens TaxID=2044597 RepID=UPI000CE1ADCA|nr:aminoacyl-tRNA deacylase [Roseovarius nitratireducens]
MAVSTPAVRRLETLDIPFQVLTYAFDATEGELGRHAAAALGIEPDAMFKTLMVAVDQSPVCAVIPVARTVALKTVARHFGGKRASMFSREALLRQTGYTVGGISPIAQKKPCPVLFDATILTLSKICINGGKRGVVLRLAPRDALVATSGETVPICAD